MERPKLLAVLVAIAFPMWLGGCLEQPSPVSIRVTAGEVEELTGEKTIEGSILVEEGGLLIVDGARLTVQGSVLVRGEMTVRESTLVVGGGDGLHALRVAGGSLDIRASTISAAHQFSVSGGRAEWSEGSLKAARLVVEHQADVAFRAVEVSESPEDDSREQPFFHVGRGNLTFNATGVPGPDDPGGHFFVERLGFVRLIDTPVDLRQLHGPGLSEVAWRVRVQTTNPSGAPVANVAVELSSLSEPGLLEARGVTSSDGVAFLEATEYTVQDGQATLRNPYRLDAPGHMGASSVLVSSQDARATLIVPMGTSP